MKSISDVVKEIQLQLEQGTNGFENNIASVDIDDEYSLFVEVSYFHNAEYLHIELIHSESTEIIDTGCCGHNTKSLQHEIRRLVANNIKSTICARRFELWKCFGFWQ